jgi:hypothetical protein
MSSNISCPRREPPEELEELEPPVELLVLPLEDCPLELLVEYLVDVLDVSWVVTSVPNSVHSSQTSSSAPSIFTRFGEAVSVPHISHWTILWISPPCV